MNSSNVLTVINNLKKALPYATREDHLNMDCGVIHEDSCGTTACHAGWYLFVTRKSTRQDIFFDGIENLCNDLGFPPSETYAAGCNPLESFAERNPLLWGNCYGRIVFSSRRAFINPTKRPNGAKNLQDIIDHWTEVYERVLALEEKKQRLLTEPPVDELIEKATRELKTEKV